MLFKGAVTSYSYFCPAVRAGLIIHERRRGKWRDSDADVTVTNRKAWEKIGSPTLEKMTTSLGAANGIPILVLGQFDAHLRRTFRPWSLLCC